MRTIHCDNRAEWLAERRRHVMSSDAATIAGARDAGLLALYAEKIGEFERDESRFDQDALEAGKRFQLPVAQWWAETERAEIIEVGDMTILESEEHPFIGATLDFIVKHPRFDEYGVLEIKYWNAGAAKLFAKGAIPAAERTQVCHQMLVTRARFGFLAVVIGGRKPLSRLIEANPLELDALLKSEREFWRHVERRDPPIASGSDDDSAYLLQGVGSGARESSTDVGANVAALFDDAKLASAAARQHETRAKSLRNQFVQAIGEANVAVFPDGRRIRCQRVDVAARDQHVDAFTYYRLDPIKEKK